MFENITFTAKYGNNSIFVKNIDDCVSAYLNSMYYDNNVKISGQDYTIGLDFEANVPSLKFIKLDTTSWNQYAQVKFSFCAVNLTNSTSYPHIKVSMASNTITPIWNHLFYNITATKVAENKFSFRVQNTLRKIDKELGTEDFTENKYFYMVMGVESNSVVQGFRLSQLTGYHEIELDTKGGAKLENVYVAHNTLLTEPVAPTKNGYTFKYWLYNGQRFNFDVKITSSIKLEAYYEEDIA